MLASPPMSRQDSPLEPARGTRDAGFAWALGLLAAAALLVRLLPALHEALWCDEAFTRSIVMRPLGKSLNGIRRDAVHPPLFYLLLRAPVGLWGGEPLPLRSISLLAGAATVVLTGFVGRRLLSSAGAGLLAATLVAASDVQIHYAHEARNYALYQAMVLASLWTLSLAMTDPTRRRWIAFGLAATALVWTHAFGWLYLATMAPAVLLAGRPGLVRSWAKTIGVVAAVFSPWAILVGRTLMKRGGVQSNLGWVKPSNPADILRRFAELTGIPQVADGVWIAIAAAVLFAGVGLVASLRAPRGAPLRERTLLVAGPAILPPILLTLGGLAPHLFPFSHPRQVVPSQAPFAILLVAGVLAIARSSRRGAVLAIASGLVLVSLQLSFSIDGLSHRRNVPFDEIAALVATTREQDEALLTPTDYFITRPLQYAVGTSVEVRNVKDLDALPPAFLMAYVPTRASDQAVEKGLRERGFVEVARWPFRVNRNEMEGVDLVRWRRAP